MERISAAEQVTIEMGDARWRLINNGSREPNIMLEAASGQPLNYLPDFALTRRLPKGGSLPVENIQRVVLGWSASDESWHLGMMLDAELAQARGSRWCEIARWPDPHTTVFGDIASRAGRSLASVMTRPFSLVPPVAVEPEPQRELPPLPIKLDEEWTLDRAANGQLELLRDKRWRRLTIRRVLWYTFWVGVYIFLVTLTFTSNVAPPNPAFLPYLGILSALILVGLIIRNIRKLSRQATLLVIDDSQRQIRGESQKRIRWSIRDNEIQSVYVTQLIGKARGKHPAPHYGELNLHMAGGKFYHLLKVDDIVEHEVEDDGARDAVVRLTSENYTTDLQAVGLYIAQALNVSAWYDRRPQ